MKTKNYNKDFIIRLIIALIFGVFELLRCKIIAMLNAKIYEPLRAHKILCQFQH